MAIDPGVAAVRVEAHTMDWVAGEIHIERLRNLAQACSSSASHQLETARDAAARLCAVQELLIASDPLRGSMAPPAPLVGAPSEHPLPPPGGVARLREGPLADLFRATDRGA